MLKALEGTVAWAAFNHAKYVDRLWTASEEIGPLRALRYLWIAAVQLRTTVSGAAPLDFCGVALTRNRCPSLVTA